MLRKSRDEFPAPWIVPAVGLAGITRKFKNSYYFAMITKNCHRGTQEDCKLSLLYTAGRRRELKEINYFPC